MSQIKLTLRPPPNVDFVHGFPGIPPVGDRPQASVRGAIEVRVNPPGVKAKWVRIELRKVETLPTGGPTNTFFDHVGPSPIVLWQSSEEYAILNTQDFPFFIRIPESIPPSIALENRAGIKYELVASVCTKGKRGFLRRSKSAIVSTISPIIIDKHELHSTWPVYCQYESRHLAQEGVNLFVERNQTCYGPGDRVSVVATLKSDSLHTVILRGFELTLKETTIFRTGPFSTAKRLEPIVRTTLIGENKFPINATLYGGSERKGELFCDISPRHTTTTLNAARHIDITYVLTVKALMGTGTHVIMNLPIILSNWPRNVSVEAIRRIGPSPSLSLIPPGPPSPQSNQDNNNTPPQNVIRVSPPAQPPTPKIDTSYLQSYLGRPSATSPSQQPTSAGPTRSASTTVINPASSHASSLTKVDEFGANRPGARANPTVDPSGYGSQPSQAPRQNFATDSRNSPNPRDQIPPKTTTTTTTPVTPRRPRSAGGGTNRLTVTNIPDEHGLPTNADPQRQRQPGPGTTAAPAVGQSRTPWPTAEEEKQRLYEKARADVERVQGNLARGPSLPMGSPPKPGVNTSPGKPTSISSSRKTPWPTAEEEKLRLYNEAQAMAKKTQAYGTYSTSLHDRSNSDLSGSASVSKPAIPPLSVAESSTAGASHRAMGSKEASGSGRIENKTSKPSSSSDPKSASPFFLTAEQEKAALKLYHEAKSAVDRVQGLIADEGPKETYNPIPYNALYPITPSPKSSPPASNDLPPPFGTTSQQRHPPSHLTEKEIFRRAYEANDVTGIQQGRSLQNGNIPTSNGYGQPSFSGSSSSGSGSQIPNEKEILRRKLETQDASISGNSGRPISPLRAPPRAGSQTGTTRPTPTTPPVASGSQILSALEEKALLKAKYEAEGRASPPNQGVFPTRSASSYVTSAKPPAPLSIHRNPTSLAVVSPGTASSTPPPPLMPRPPEAYIKETQEEDARVSRYVSQGITPPLDHVPPPSAVFLQRQPTYNATVDLGAMPGPPPPLPGNVPIQ